ncbi:PilZ domain-containing protein [Thermosulfurimonas marina]|uniref:PilZ domain-containing protein n=1 Tax=Thermosulfurimonas marina TaxID=2047767 RepID=A0A6H1WS34_9BACT|nr:PilZ domain-containing protein [Thermosulfurimonas marina]QJA05964.1 PilZ domain-containing protein [Thermosulfurimonas marina]
MGEEKRWYNRYLVHVDGSLANGALMCRVEVLDLSAEGARIRGDLGRLKPGDVIKFCIQAKPPIKLGAEVRWVKKTPQGYEAGLKFQDVPFQVRQHLQLFLSQVALASTPEAYFR